MLVSVNDTSTAVRPGWTVGVTVRSEYSNVVYDRPCPNQNVGSTSLASYQRYPISSPSS